MDVANEIGKESCMKKILVFACLLAILGGCTSTKGHKDEQKNAVVGEALAFLKE
jgi:hypothetical protein